MNKFLEFQNEEDFWKEAITFTKSTFGSKYGLSGGSASQILQYLPADFVRDGNWFLIDERKVDLENEQSNCKLIKGISSKIQLNCPWHDDDFESKLPESLDILIMGVGPDGHIASLFNKVDWLRDDYLIETFTNEFEVMERVSLNMKYLLKSKRVLLLMQGKSKFEIWNRMKKLNIEKKGGVSPIEYFLNHYDGDLVGLYLE